MVLASSCSCQSWRTCGCVQLPAIQTTCSTWCVSPCPSRSVLSAVVSCPRWRRGCAAESRVHPVLRRDGVRRHGGCGEVRPRRQDDVEGAQEVVRAEERCVRHVHPNTGSRRGKRTSRAPATAPPRHRRCRLLSPSPPSPRRWSRLSTGSPSSTSVLPSFTASGGGDASAARNSSRSTHCRALFPMKRATWLRRDDAASDRSPKPPLAARDKSTRSCINRGATQTTDAVGAEPLAAHRQPDSVVPGTPTTAPWRRRGWPARHPEGTASPT